MEGGQKPFAGPLLGGARGHPAAGAREGDCIRGSFDGWPGPF